MQEVIAAADEIATRPYVYGGGHGSFTSEGYDCSGSVSYALHGGGLLSSPEDSTGLESYGEPGPGRYITIYADAEHAWMTIDGRRFDTVALAEDGSRWSDSMASTAGFVVRHPTGCRGAAGSRSTRKALTRRPSHRPPLVRRALRWGSRREPPRSTLTGRRAPAALRPPGRPGEPA